MCNFVIRPQTAYCTVDLYDDDGETLRIKQGAKFETLCLKGRYVTGKVDDVEVGVPLEVYIHTFSDKDPNKKPEKTDKK